MKSYLVAAVAFTVLQSASAFASIAVPVQAPGPEIGAGIAGMMLVGGVVYAMNRRAKRKG